MSEAHIMKESPKVREAHRDMVVSWLDALMRVKFSEAQIEIDLCEHCGSPVKYTRGTDELLQFAPKQKPLGFPFQNVLDDNKWELYER